MNPIQAQTRREHLVQAQAALMHYPIGHATLAFQGDSESITFRVHSEGNSARFLLRRHKPQQQAHHTEIGLRSEMDWLAAIRADTDIIAPTPVVNLDGGSVTDSNNALWTLTTWVEGRFLTDQRAPSRAFRAGETLARLHQHSETWERPLTWTRPRHDALRLQEHLETYRQAASAGLLPGDDLGVVEAAAERVIWAMSAVGQAASAFGLIHGDFHNRNYLFHRGQVRPIDFSLCGDGFYLADLSYALCSQWHRIVFLNGYESLRPLRQEQRHLIETFMVSGILGETGFHMRQGWSQKKPFDHPTWLINNLRDKYLKDKHFLINW